MASSVDIVPSLGFGALYLQTGPSSGYNAVDDRRKSHPFASEGVLTAAAYKVTQRAAGVNLSVDVAANVAAANGASALVMGDSITSQGLYTVVAHTGVVNLDITPANASNPRNDLVVLEVKDNQHDVGGLNVARVRVITGTATAGAAMTDAYGVNGTPALPASCLPLAVVNVPASDTTISESQIDDRRPRAAQSIGGGKCIVATAEARTNTAYGTLTTPDQVSGIVLPTDGLLAVGYQAYWKSSVGGAGSANIFVGSTGLQYMDDLGDQDLVAVTTGTGYNQLASNPTTGLASSDQSGADRPQPGAGVPVIMGPSQVGIEYGLGGPVYIWNLAAGTYTVSVRFKASSGSVTAKERKLWVWTMAFG